MPLKNKPLIDYVLFTLGSRDYHRETIKGIESAIEAHLGMQREFMLDIGQYIKERDKVQFIEDMQGFIEAINKKEFEELRELALRGRFDEI